MKSRNKRKEIKQLEKLIKGVRMLQIYTHKFETSESLENYETAQKLLQERYRVLTRKYLHVGVGR